jgi:hypothetical protein
MATSAKVPRSLKKVNPKIPVFEAEVVHSDQVECSP